ncbi:hypothetical protein DSM3645_22846 [Blastopirellula marina DSM 3645]|uniref:Uncharacterized protein n=1 Tax=Blastopirellula marina DSM 3645 TaxID=314230 RepID=A3ZQ06_9BACT|nr:hypothetical protein DSM3645_22846 [Blastopirellula marina DSM 3645]
MTFLEIDTDRLSEPKFVVRDDLDSIQCRFFSFWLSTRQQKFCGSDVMPWSKADTTLCRY